MYDNCVYSLASDWIPLTSSDLEDLCTNSPGSHEQLLTSSVLNDFCIKVTLGVVGAGGLHPTYATRRDRSQFLYYSKRIRYNT